MFEGRGTNVYPCNRLTHVLVTVPDSDVFYYFTDVWLCCTLKITLSTSMLEGQLSSGVLSGKIICFSSYTESEGLNYTIGWILMLVQKKGFGSINLYHWSGDIGYQSQQ